MRPLMVISAAVLLAHHGGAQNFYLGEGGPPGYPGPGGSPFNGSPFGGPAPTTKPSRPSFFRNPLAAASNLHKTVIAGIRAPAFLSNLLPSASAPRPSIFSFAKPPRGFSGSGPHSVSSGHAHTYSHSFGPESAASNNYPNFFSRPGGSPPSGGPGPSSFYSHSNSGHSGSPYAGLPPNVISALQNSQFDHSTLSGDQQEAATNVHEISGSPYDRSPPRIRASFGSSDDSDISASAVSSSLANAGSGAFDASSYGSSSGHSLSSLQGASGASVAQSLLSQQAASASSGSTPTNIAGYDIGVPVQLGFQSHTSEQGSSSGQQVNSIGPAYQIDTSSIQYPSSYQQSVSQGQSGQNSYSGLATGYGSGDVSKQQSSYSPGQSYVVGSSLSYDGKTGATSYASPTKQTDYASQGGYSSYSSGGQVGGNEALVQALKAYANGNVKYVPGKPAVSINHQLQQNSHQSPTSYSTSTTTSSNSYGSPHSAKSGKYTSSSSTTTTTYSSPVKSASGYSNPVKSSSIRYSSNSGGLSYAESSPQAKYAPKPHFESTRTVGSSLKFGDSSSSPSSSSPSSSQSSSSSSSSSASAAAAAKKKSS